jgi:hypothetical protein
LVNGNNIYSLQGLIKPFPRKILGINLDPTNAKKINNIIKSLKLKTHWSMTEHLVE